MKPRKRKPSPPRKPTGAAATPPSLAPRPSTSLAPLPSVRLRLGEEGAPMRCRPSFAPPPSVRTGPGEEGAPIARRRGKCAAAPPSFAPLPSVRMGAGEEGGLTAKRRGKWAAARGGGDAPRRRKGSPPPRDARRTDSGDSSGRSGSDDSQAAGEDDSQEGFAGGGDDGRDLGAGGVAAARGTISVAHTPNTPPRFEGLLKSITSLLPYENRGKSYECSMSRMKTFLKWSKSKVALFFEWNDDQMQMNCWMHNIQKEESYKLIVNAAFSFEQKNINVQRATVAFSSNFSGGDKYWLGLKEMILNIFGSFEEGLEEYDYLYVFTRMGDSICFRNYKIISLPRANAPLSGLVLTEINTTFSLKLVNDQGTYNSSDIGPHLPKDQIHTKLSLCPVSLYSIPNGQTGSCLIHDADFCGTSFSFLLENGIYVSSLEKLEGFNTSLAEIIVKEPLLKMKHIIGSATNKIYCFARRRFKSILQSLFAEFAMLLESGKCISDPSALKRHSVLVRGTEVKLYGLHVTNFTEKLAEQNVRALVTMLKRCFTLDGIPIDLSDLFKDLFTDPLNEIKRAKDDASLLKAEDRRSLLININSDYMTNVEAKSSESNKINEVTFFDGCPDAEDWEPIMKDNEYLVQVCNVKESSDDDKVADGGYQKVNPSVKERMKKKKRISTKTANIRKIIEKKKKLENRGRLRFSSKRNFLMHMPERARKDGIFPFRLGMADYILTAYFPRFLRFVQKRIREVKAQREVQEHIIGQRA